MVAVRRDESQDEAGRERAQHHIKLEQERQTGISCVMIGRATAIIMMMDSETRS